MQDKTALPDRYNLGDELKVSFNIKGTKWAKDGKDNYITNLDAWRIEQVKLNQSNTASNDDGPAANRFTPNNELVDDLPF